jgi:hypothetical protein
MKDLIRQILSEELPSNPYGEKRVLNKREVILFKYLNKHKHELKTQKEMIDEIRRMLSVVDLPDNLARFYYELYTANYRPDGDYENITPDKFKDYTQFVQRKTPNNTAYEYSSAKVPFKGSNVEGKWGVNDSNQWYYVVESWGWYPVFLFINDQWYRVLDTYSHSTRKQMNQSNPVIYNSGLNANVIGVTRGEISDLMNGRYDISDMKSKRVVNFVKNMKSELIGKKKLISSGWGGNGVRVSYVITDVDNVDGKINIEVKINKAGKMVDRKMVIDPEYQNDEQLVNNIENGIKQDIMRTHPEYLSDDNVNIEIIH